jgi:glycosyltransferase involved in cell wall biosynthesis
MRGNKIKICHLTSAHPNNDIRIFHKECSSLAKENYFDVYLVSVNSEEKTENKVKLVNAISNSSNRFTRIFHSSRSVYRKAKELDADIYHFHDPELLPYGLKLKKQGKVVIYDAHEDVPRQILGKPWIPLFLRRIISFCFEKYENFICKKLSCIVTSTPTIEARFKKVNPLSLAICNYPILSENEFIPNWSERLDEVCYVGGISEIRGIKEIIRVLGKSESYRLNLAGAFSPINLREDIIKEKGWSFVNEYGVVNRTQIINILNKSKIGLVTLHPRDNYLDSLPIKMFEYMYAGIPVIASDFPLWKKIIQDNDCGKCVDPFNLDEIMESIDYLMKNSSIAEKMGKNGRKAVIEKYNWSVEEEKLVHLYRQLL